MSKESEAISVNIINEGTHVKGDINTDSDIRFDGKLEGDLTSALKVVTGSQSSIIGNIVCNDGDISGIVQGNVSVKGTLTLKSTAKVTGDIIASKLIIEPDAYLSGHCSMTIE